jgi:integrase
MPMGRQPTKYLNLPKGMRARPQRSGKIYYYFDLGNKERSVVPLGSDYVIAVKKWAELSQREIPKNATITFKMAWDNFLIEHLPKVAASTQKDYLKSSKKLLEFFNDPPAPLDAIKPVHVRQYLDIRGKESPIRANHEIRLLNLIWNLARSWNYTDKENPCTGIKRFTEKSRDVYVEDDVYNAVYEYSCQPVKDAKDLGYLTAQRPIDVIKMDETDISDGLLAVQQTKRGAKLRIAITGQLKSVIDRIQARKKGFKVFSLKLIVDEHGKPLSQHAIYKRFVKAKEQAKLHYPKLSTRIDDYDIRDLRAKGVTDKTESGDIREAQMLAGHASETMTERYVRRKIGHKAQPTK